MATEKKFSIKVEIEKSIESVNKFKDSLANIPGPIGGVVQGLGGLTTAARAFIATPIGAIVAVLGAVFMALKKGIESSEKATMGLNKIMGAFNGIIGPVIKSIGLLAETLIDSVVWAMEKVLDLGEALGLSFAENAKAGMKLAESLNQIEEAEGDLEVARAQQNKTLAEAREILSDTNATYAERKKALDEVRKSEEALAQREVELAKQRVAAAKENIRLNGASAAANDQLDQALIKLANTEQNLAAKRRLFNKEEKKLIAEVEAAAKEAATKAEADRKERLAKEKEYQEKRKTIAREIAKTEIELEAELNGNRYQERVSVLYDLNKLELDSLKEQLKKKELTQKEYDTKVSQSALRLQLDLAKLEKEYAAKATEGNKALNEELADSLEQRRDLEIKNEKERLDAIKANLYAEFEMDAQSGETFLQAQQIYNKKVAMLDAELVENRRKIEEKYSKEKAEKALADLDKSIQEQNLALEKGLNDGTIKIEEEEAKRRQIELDSLQQRIEILKQNGQDVTDAEIAYYEKLNEYREKDLEKEKENAEKKKQIRIQQISGILTAANDVANAVGAIQDMQMQKELNAAGDNLEKQEAIKREYFEKNKKVQIAQAIIAAIQGAVGAFTSMSAIPVVGPILGGIAAAAALVAGYANVQKIRNTTYESANGGGGGGTPTPTPSKFAKGGVLHGRKHAEGGVMTAFGELEGGEYVINREATSSFLPLLDKINSMGSGSGAPNNLSSQAEMRMGGGTPIIKTYVVASEVSSQQEADKRISDLARL